MTHDQKLVCLDDDRVPLIGDQYSSLFTYVELRIVECSQVSNVVCKSDQEVYDFFITHPLLIYMSETELNTMNNIDTL